ncbi:MAG: chemosensory pili system protein ChpB (putative protein-glutamate methylesterase) [Lentisphaeria bacterium]|jgi:chemosensory pili system protein ChpB (putative protein-glutamate methylesterase)
MHLSELRLGLLADSSIQLSNLKSIVASANYTVTAALLTRSDNLKNIPEVDLWVARIDGEDRDSKSFLEYLDSLEIPVIYDEADSYSSLDVDERAKRFSKKILVCGSESAKNTRNVERATSIWVLAASAGGPEAVIEFIKRIPKEVKNVAFVYVQHIDGAMALPLCKTLGRHTSWPVVYGDSAHVLFEQSIYVVSPNHQVEFDDVGRISPLGSPWSTLYRPSVDEVAAKVALRFGKESGLIVFSGMGDDGVKACKLMKRTGGQVWAQSLSSCKIDSMPKEAIATQCVSFTGNPEQLADHFLASLM